MKKKKNKPLRAEKIYLSNDVPIWGMALLSIVLGIIVGYATIIFRYLIGIIFNLSFLGRFSASFRPDENTPQSPWGVFIILAPVCGAILLVWLIRTFVKDSDSHGVPEIISRIYHSREKRKTFSGIIMGFSAALSIGTGGSAGNESPYIQVGASIADGMSERLSLSKKQRNILIGAGGAAALATCLNAPFTGIIFSIELILVTINISSLFPVALCTISAVYVYRVFFGAKPTFFIPEDSVFEFSRLPMEHILLFLVFGIALGILSIFYIRSYRIIERMFHKIGNPYIRHISGMLLIGVIIYFMGAKTGRYYIEGIGEYAVFDVLKQNILSPWFLLLLVFLKIIATSVTVGSGSSGGVFTPLLFIGAVFGAFFCQAANYFMPELDLKPLPFVMAGMAGMISSSIGAFLTGMAASFEMFGNIHYVLPVILTAGTAFAVRKLSGTDSVYAMSLKAKGLIVPEGLQAAIIPAINAAHVMSDSFKVIDIEKAFALSKDKLFLSDKNFSVIFEKGQLSGVLKNPVEKFEDLEEFREQISKKIMIFHLNTSFLEISNMMIQNKIKYAIISSRARTDKPYSIKGIITFKEIEALTLKEYNWLN